MKPRSAFLIVAVAASLFAMAGLAAAQSEDAVARGVAYIASTQQPDGGFGGFGPGQTMDAIYAIRAGGVDPNEITNGGNSPADYLVANAAGATSSAAAAKAALAAVALGLDPESVGGVDLIAAIEAGYDDGTGRYAEDDFGHSIAIMGLACTGFDPGPGALQALLETQLDDGGWGFEGASDVDTTAIALQAVIAAGTPLTDDAVEAAVAYLQGAQATDGGWGFTPDESNTSSTAFAVQALLAAGENPLSAEYETAAGGPIDYLLSQQAEDGSFAGFDPAFATNQVVPALAGRSFCDAPSTPITNEPPTTPTATPTATATPTQTATATPTTPATSTPISSPTRTTTVAPRPPNTGSGTAGDGGSGAWLVLGAIAAGAAGVSAVVLRRKR